MSFHYFLSSSSLIVVCSDSDNDPWSRNKKKGKKQKKSPKKRQSTQDKLSMLISQKTTKGKNCFVSLYSHKRLSEAIRQLEALRKLEVLAHNFTIQNIICLLIIKDYLLM